MENLFDANTRAALLARIQRLRPDSPRGWGKLNCAQMLAHCALGMEAATGDAKLARPLPARLIGWMFKGWVLGPKPFSKNSPTHPQLAAMAPREFERERTRLVAAINKFCAAGPQSAERFEHAFVGKLTGAEWGVMQYKHLDHHLRQFGV